MGDLARVIETSDGGVPHGSILELQVFFGFFALPQNQTKKQFPSVSATLIESFIDVYTQLCIVFTLVPSRHEQQQQ